jgi:hypothetical protein
MNVEPTAPTAPADAALEAGCDHFEATLLLLDGTLDAAAASLAHTHAGACDLCGPMLREWEGLSAAFVATFEAAAERAKPDLARMSDRVLAALATPAKPAARTFGDKVAAFFSFLQAPAALVAAAAAIAFVVGPLLKTAPAGEPTDLAADAAPPASLNDCRVTKLAFEDADGMVFETPEDHMTVIWVSEHEGV